MSAAAWLLVSVLALGAAPASEEAADGYCRWLEGVADAESSLMMAPSLFATGGLVNSPLGDPSDALGVKPRLMLGLQYDFVRLYQGMTLRRRAAAECRGFRASQRLEALVGGQEQIGLAEALAARAEVLAEALPKAEAMLSRLRVELTEARSATLDELNATELRVDGLRALFAQTAREQAALAAAEPAEAADLTPLLEARRGADLESQRLAANLRESSAWGFHVRAGYDRVFGLESGAPFFATLNLSYNLGGLLQPEANARAEQGRRLWARGEDADVETRLAELRAVHAAERARLGQTRMLLADLEARLRELDGLSSEKARAFREFLWLELVKVKAEHVWLEAHTAAIARFLGEAKEAL